MHPKPKILKPRAGDKPERTISAEIVERERVTSAGPRRYTSPSNKHIPANTWKDLGFRVQGNQHIPANTLKGLGFRVKGARQQVYPSKHLEVVVSIKRRIQQHPAPQVDEAQLLCLVLAPLVLWRSPQDKLVPPPATGDLCQA